ncbi:MAG: ABC transporter ATP-binding protein [Bacteroidota bacterium]
MLLKVENLVVNYGKIKAVSEVSLEVGEGEIVALVGANGAGKSTILRTISALHRPTGGRIVFRGEEIHSLRGYQVARKGIIHVPEGRMVVPHFTAEENLLTGTFRVSDKTVIAERLEAVFSYFPILRARARQKAGTLSGGEQQMLAIGRGLMMDPDLLLLDEPSLGLAPLIIENIYQILKKINQNGTAILIVEQNVYEALELSSRAYVLENGKIALEGTSRELINDQRVKEGYLGGNITSNCD